MSFNNDMSFISSHEPIYNSCLNMYSNNNITKNIQKSLATMSGSIGIYDNDIVPINSCTIPTETNILTNVRNSCTLINMANGSSYDLENNIIGNLDKNIQTNITPIKGCSIKNNDLSNVVNTITQNLDNINNNILLNIQKQIDNTKNNIQNYDNNLIPNQNTTLNTIKNDLFTNTVTYSNIYDKNILTINQMNDTLNKCQLQTINLKNMYDKKLSDSNIASIDCYRKKGITVWTEVNYLGSSYHINYYNNYLLTNLIYNIKSISVDNDDIKYDLYSGINRSGITVNASGNQPNLNLYPISASKTWGTSIADIKVNGPLY